MSKDCTFKFCFCPPFLFTHLLFKLQTGVWVRHWRSVYTPWLLFLFCWDVFNLPTFWNDKNLFFMLDLMLGGNFRCKCMEWHNNYPLKHSCLFFTHPISVHLECLGHPSKKLFCCTLQSYPLLCCTFMRNRLPTGVQTTALKFLFHICLPPLDIIQLE